MPSLLPPVRSLLLGTLSSLLLAPAAGAQLTVAPARYAALVLHDDPNPARNEGASSAAPGDYATSDGMVTASIRTSPYTLLSAHAAGSAAVDYVSNGSAYMWYDFRIIGPAGTRVGASIMAELFASFTGPVYDERSISIASVRLNSAANSVGRFYDTAGNPLNSIVQQTVRLNGGPSRRVTALLPFIVDANEEYEVQLQAVAQVATPGGVADASVDPVITIDPIYRSAYTLVLSDGVSNLAPTATAPEPGTLALLATGVVGLVGVARRYSRFVRA